ncbi:MAG TPA: hypothetical protein VKS22_11415 [Candidatus Binataceae bacterium]|nr:hypothetical protein [Candidatus Binataceae bacterium]
MANAARSLRRKNITDLARGTWSRIWREPMPSGWKVYLVRKTVIQHAYGRHVCGVTQHDRKTILIGRNTDHYSFRTMVHELAHLRTLGEELDHGPRWEYEFHRVAHPALGAELDKDI